VGNQTRLPRNGSAERWNGLLDTLVALLTLRETLAGVDTESLPTRYWDKLTILTHARRDLALLMRAEIGRAPTNYSRWSRTVDGAHRSQRRLAHIEVIGERPVKDRSGLRDHCRTLIDWSRSQVKTPIRGLTGMLRTVPIGDCLRLVSDSGRSGNF
jgi:hypothetical protein